MLQFQKPIGWDLSAHALLFRLLVCECAKGSKLQSQSHYVDEAGEASVRWRLHMA